MNVVYMVQHVHLINADDEQEDVKMIGVYTTEERAHETVDRLRQQPGLCDTPDAFYIDRYELNQDHWTDGYITVPTLSADA